MIFSQETMHLGGQVIIPHSFVNQVDPGEIVEITHAGIHVIWFKGKPNQQRGFFSFAWLNQEYGENGRLVEDAQKDCPLPKNDLDDDIPF